MIRIPGLALRSFFVSVLFVAAMCQVTHAQGLPPDVKTSNNPQAIRAPIQEFMNKQFPALAGTDADAQSKARTALIAESTFMQGAANTATAVYTDVYAQELNQRLEALAKDKATIRVRTNAAIVLATVAQQTSNAQLRGATIALLNDPCEAIVIWALKAARPLLPVVLKMAPPDPKLITAIVAAAKKFPKGNAGGAIAMEAYYALTLDISDPNKAKLILPAMHKAVTPAILDLMTFRIAQYQKGIPAEVRAERIPTFYLTDVGAWKEMTAQQQTQVMELISHLLVLAGEQAKAANVSREDRKELAITVGVAARSMSRAASTAGAAALVAALKPATELADADVAGQVKSDDVASRVAGVFPALKAHTAFAKAQPPPAVVGHEQAPPPASAPTTGPVEIPGAGPVVPAPVAPAPVAPAPGPAAPAPGPAAPASPTQPAAPGARPGATPAPARPGTTPPAGGARPTRPGTPTPGTATPGAPAPGAAAPGTGTPANTTPPRQ